MPDSLVLDTEDLTSQQIADLLDIVKTMRAQNITDDYEIDDESWRAAKSSGWTLEHVEILREHLKSRGARVQLEAFDLAIKQGGFVSREQVYAIGGYPPNRKLNNWTAPINNFADDMEHEHDLPHKADYPIKTEYGAGKGYRPAIGFTVLAEIVKLVREAE